METCDDGNTDVGDGCSGGCQLESLLDQCSAGIAEAGWTYVSKRLKAMQSCRNKLNRGISLFSAGPGGEPLTDPAECENEVATSSRIATAGAHMRAAITGRVGRCTDAIVSDLGACADTVDGMVSSAGDGGCLVDKYAASVDELLAKEYGRTVAAEGAAARTCQEAVGRGGSAIR